MMDLPMRAIQRLHCLDDLTASTVSRASPTPGLSYSGSYGFILD